MHCSRLRPEGICMVIHFGSSTFDSTNRASLSISTVLHLIISASTKRFSSRENVVAMVSEEGKERIVNYKWPRSSSKKRRANENRTWCQPSQEHRAAVGYKSETTAKRKKVE